MSASIALRTMDDSEIVQAANLNVEQRESIKLIKNSKGYVWEIRILNLDIDRLQSLDAEMRARFRTEI
jgi:hypothetical protein